MCTGACLGAIMGALTYTQREAEIAKRKAEKEAEKNKDNGSKLLSTCPHCGRNVVVYLESQKCFFCPVCSEVIQKGRNHND